MSETGEGLKPTISRSEGGSAAPKSMSTEIFREIVEGVLPIEQGQVERAVGEAIAARTGFPVPKTEEGRREFVAERLIGGGAGWLFDNPRDLVFITDEKLMRTMEGLERMYARGILDDPTERNSLLRAKYMEIEERRVAGEIDPQEADECQIRISRRVQERTGFVGIEDPKSPESVTRGILTALNQLERDAGGERKRLEEFSKEKLDAIKNAIDAIPPEVDKSTDKDEALSAYLGREIRLKEKLGLALEARRRLHNRKIEVVRADGDLKQLGVGEKIPLAEGIAIPFTNIEAIHWHVLLHFDDLFKNELGAPDPEIAVPVAEAMRRWSEAGEAWDKPVFGGISFKKALNSAQKIQGLRNAIGQVVGRRAEEIARDIFAVTMTFGRWDKERKKIGGKNDARDLMYFDLKRAMDFAKLPESLKTAGPEDTIGSYFAEEKQGEIEKKTIKKPDGTEIEIPEETTPEQRRRLKILMGNKGKDRSVFQYSLDKKRPIGHLVGDLWTSNSISIEETRDQNGKPVIERSNDKEKPKVTLCEIAQKYGWKSIPVLQGFEDPYSGYFSYFLNMSESISTLVEKMGWDFEKDGLATPGFWQKTMMLFDRMRIFSPVLNTLNTENPGDAKKIEEAVMKWRMVFALGILWDGSHRAKTGQGMLGILMRTEVGKLTYRQVRDIYRAIEQSRFLSKEYLKQLKSLVGGQGRKYNFSMGDVRTGKSTQMDYNMVRWGK